MIQHPLNHDLARPSIDLAHTCLRFEPPRRCLIQIHKCEFSRAINRSPHLQSIDSKAQSARLPQTKLEMTMRNKILLFVVPLVAALTLQAAAAAEHHHTRTKARAMPTEQWWNSYAYEAPGYNSYAYDAPGYGRDPYESPGYLASEDEGAMSAGMAGH
jgi:hypothetical protein